MPFVTAVAGATAALIGLLVAVLLRRRLVDHSALQQVVAGLVVGLVAALVVLASFFDLVPDAWEPSIGLVGLAVVSIAAVAALVYRVVRR